MKQKCYAILFKKNESDLEDYDYLFEPVSVIEGYYDSYDRSFVDEYDIERVSYNNPDLCMDEVEFVIGEIATRGELKELFPDAKKTPELKKMYFFTACNFAYYGIYNSDTGEVDIVCKKYDEIITNNQEETTNISLSGDLQDDCMKQSFTLVTDEDVDKIENINDESELKSFLEYLKYEKNLYNEKASKIGIYQLLISDGDMDKFQKLNIDQIKDAINLLKEKAIEKYHEISSQNNNSNEEELIDNSYVNGTNVINIFERFNEQVKLCETVNDVDDVLNIVLTLCENILNDINIIDKNRNDDVQTKKFFNIYINTIKTIMRSKNLEDKKVMFASLYTSTYDTMLGMIKEILGEDIKETINEEEMHKNEEADNKKQKIKELIDSVDKSMNRLNQMIGLEKIKKQIQTFKNVKIYENLVDDYIKHEDKKVNMVFYGNPGTGKTTVAKLLGEIFYSLGYTKSNKVTECTATDLIGEYVGQTGPKAKKLFSDNKGGIIFIDEAYGLVSEGNDSFSNDALVELLKEFEKGEIIFILAGYRNEMKKFIDSNPGLKNRINYYFDYEDYTVEQLYDIFEKIINDKRKENSLKGYVIDEEAKLKIKEIIGKGKNEKHFGNGRFVENLAKSILAIHANRVITTGICDIDELLKISLDDVDESKLENLNLKENKKTIGFSANIETPKQKVLKQDNK